MAVAEARTAWQRTANRCFVQEDAKRAPKLACCQQSATAAKQVDPGPAGAAEAQDTSATGFMPFNRNPSYPDLPSDARWWLQMQPSYGYQKGLVNGLEAEIESLKADFLNSPFKDSKKLRAGDNEDINWVDSKKDGNNPSKSDREDKVKMLSFTEFMEMRERYGFREMDSVETKKISECCFDPESPWISTEKNGPWWRTTDKEELASFVARKSLDYIVNCDLPPPQISRCSFGNARCSPASVKRQGKPNDSVEDANAKFCSEKTSSCGINHDNSTEGSPCEKDLSKTELLEALRHSQSRAREAEKATKEAYAEKEHITKLFFKQASQLFAYKQWFQLLQLETLYLQLRNNEPSLPWMPFKGKRVRKNWHKAGKDKRSKRYQPRCHFAVAFALGLSLVGAGLLLGWTVGWMLGF